MKDHPVIAGTLGAGSALYAQLPSASEVAAWLAAILNFLLIVRFLWRSFVRPYMIRRGYFKVRPKGENYLESTGHGPL